MLKASQKLMSILKLENVSKSFTSNPVFAKACPAASGEAACGAWERSRRGYDGHGKNKLDVLRDVSFEFKSDESYAIIGVSGVGKSTLMHILAGIDFPTSGQVYFGPGYTNQPSLKNYASKKATPGGDINKFNSAEKEIFFNKNIGLVFQEPYLIPELSVLENVMLKGAISGEKDNLTEKAFSLLKRVNLENKAYENPLSLSGGQQQRVAILRSIFNKPDFILADEPTGNLDEIAAAQIRDLLLEYCNEFKIGLIVSSHDSLVANSMNVKLKLAEHKLVTI